MYILITVAWVSVGRNANKLLLLTNKVYLIRSYNNVNNHIACALPKSTNCVLYMQKNSGVMTNEQVCLVLFLSFYFTEVYNTCVDEYLKKNHTTNKTKTNGVGGGDIN